MSRHLHRARFMLRHPRYLWWAITNRAKGYQFGYVQRFRCCDHTTPHHYRWCDVPAADTATQDDPREPWEYFDD